MKILKILQFSYANSLIRELIQFFARTSFSRLRDHTISIRLVSWRSLSRCSSAALRQITPNTGIASAERKWKLAGSSSERALTLLIPHDLM